VHVTKSGVALGCLPWPRSAHLLAGLDRPVAHEESATLARDCLRSVLLGLRGQLEGHGGPRLGLAHAMVDGATTDHEQPIVGGDMAVSVQDLALLDVPFFGVGHVHAQNAWKWNGVEVVYPGALIHRNFGEPGPKGYVIAEFDGPRLVGWERIASPATRMILLEAVWEGPDRAFCRNLPSDLNFENGAEIRLRYSVDSDKRDAAKHAAAKVAAVLKERGAVSVKVEECVRPVIRARAPEIAAATSLVDKLAALRKARGQALPAARIERLNAKICQVEEECHHAV